MRPIVRWAGRMVGALIARGEFIPAVTRIEAGKVVEVSPEKVVPKGVLRSKTVWAGIIAGVFAFANSQGWALGLSAEDAQTIFGYISAGGGVGAIVSRILAWMPTRGPSGGG